MNRDVTHKAEYTQEISDNLDKLLILLNKFRTAYGKPMIVTSGWRPQGINSKIGGAKRSLHVQGRACDFADPNGELATFAKKMDSEGKLAEWGLWLENPDKTPGWIHLDNNDRGKRKSNIFKP